MLRNRLGIPVELDSWINTTIPGDLLASAWATTTCSDDPELVRMHAEIARRRVAANRLKAVAVLVAGAVVSAAILVFLAAD